MSFHFAYLIECLQEGIKYIPITLKLTFIVFFVSAILGLVIATIRFFKVPVLSQILAFFVTVYMGIPNVLALNVYYLILTMIFKDFVTFFHLSLTLKDVNFIIVAYITLILSDSCWMSENYRGAYKAIEKVQFEAGYSIGLTKFQTIRRIILPQLFPIVLPNLMNWLTGTVKNVSLISAIGLIEVMGGSLKPSGRTYSFLEGYMAASIIYWVMVIILEQIGKALEKPISKFRREII